MADFDNIALGRAARIRCLFLDIDGVMSDCKLYLGPDGMEIKAVNVRDGLGMRMLLHSGIEVAVISGRPSAAMQRRLEGLGVCHIALDTLDKLPAFIQIRDQLGLRDDECAFMGDDLPDVPVMRLAGLACVPADAHPSAVAEAHWQSRHEGGNGAIREAVDLILAAQGIDPLGAARLTGARS